MRFGGAMLSAFPVGGVCREGVRIVGWVVESCFGSSRVRQRAARKKCMLLLGVVPAVGGAFLGWLAELPVQPGQNCRHRHDKDREVQWRPAPRCEGRPRPASGPDGGVTLLQARANPVAPGLFSDPEPACDCQSSAVPFHYPLHWHGSNHGQLPPRAPGAQLGKVASFALGGATGISEAKPPWRGTNRPSPGRPPPCRALLARLKACISASLPHDAAPGSSPVATRHVLARADSNCACTRACSMKRVETKPLNGAAMDASKRAVMAKLYGG